MISAVDIAHTLGQYLIPILVILFFIAVIIMLRVMVSRYQKIPPNKVAIIFGRGTKVGGEGQIQGCKVVSGGGVFVWPVFQSIDYMDTAAFRMAINETGVPNKENVGINVAGVAVCKISTSPEDLQSAAMSFLGQSQAQIQETISSVLIGHLRSIIGKLDIDGILRDRDSFNRMVVNESNPELKRMGIQIVTLVIQEVSDEHGYIAALGKRAVAEAVRDADIKVAQAQAATRMSVSQAQREASVVEAQNAVAIADAEKDRDIKRATFKAAADTELALANQALAIATAAQEQILRVAQADRDTAAADAQTKVQEAEAKRMEQQLQATVIKPAEAEKSAAIIKAEGLKQAAILEAEAQGQVVICKAEGDATAAKKLGEGMAAQTLATLTAKAQGEAAVTEQALLAKAKGEAAQKGLVLTAEAEGTKKLADALAQMTESARLILILDRLPILMDRGGEAASKVAQAVFSSVAAPFGQIDSLRIVDMGGNGKALEGLGDIVPNTVFKFLAGMQARGIDIKKVLAKLGIDADEITSMLNELGSTIRPVVAAGDLVSDSDPA
ncbi:MAG: SPFH domain-containing protein [Candidatus Staskawiczbacteria bacterium]|jgi:flotillin